MHEFSIIVFVDYGVDVKQTIKYLVRNIHPRVRVRSGFIRINYSNGIIRTRNLYIRVVVYSPHNIIGLRANITCPNHPELIKGNLIPTDNDCTLYMIEQYLLRDIYDILVNGS